MDSLLPFRDGAILLPKSQVMWDSRNYQWLQEEETNILSPGRLYLSGLAHLPLYLLEQRIQENQL